MLTREQLAENVCRVLAEFRRNGEFFDPETTRYLDEWIEQTYFSEEPMETQTENQGFDSWAIVEIMGRQVIAGRVAEEVIAGAAMLRVDVPAVGDQPAFTRFYGSQAIYCLTPVSEEVARLAVKRYEPRPVTIYIPELRQLQAPAAANGSPWEDEADPEGDEEDEDWIVDDDDEEDDAGF